MDELTPTSYSTIRSIGLTRQYMSCLESLYSHEASDRFHGVEMPFKGTDDWLFGDDIGFLRFLRGEDDRCVFWITSKPGSGKSTVMKYAVKHEKTLQALERFHGDPWVIVKHFFHDRGSATQKSVTGFLRALLRQILIARKDAFPYVYPMLGDAGSLENRDVAGYSFKTSSHPDSWTDERLITAISVISQNIDTTLNLCVFVDALDEVQGTYGKLIDVIRRLEAMTENKLVRLRICAASRPENLFKTEFADYPSLAVHEHTMEDIRLYTESRMRYGTHDMLTEAGHASFGALTKSIIRRANGVFLWVKLVVDELVEGFQNGDTLSEMKALLLLMPDELFGLYTRAMAIRHGRSPKKPEHFPRGVRSVSTCRIRRHPSDHN